MIPEYTSVPSVIVAGDMSGNLDGVVDCRGYKRAAVQLTAPSATHVGTFAFLFSMDGVLANATAVTLSTTVTASSGSALNAWVDLDVYGPYLHVTYTAGSGAGTLTATGYVKE